MSLASALLKDRSQVDGPAYDLSNVDDLPDDVFVDLVYRVVFGRKADPFGLEHHTRLLSEGKRSRAHFVNELILTPDFRKVLPDAPLNIENLPDEVFVDLVYQVLFGRKADPFGLEHHTRLLSEGKRSRAHFVNELILTPDFRKVLPDAPLNIENLPDEVFVDLVYQVLFGRKADPFGLQHHTSLLSDGTRDRAHLVHELAQSPEFKNVLPDIEDYSEEDFVSLVYQAILKRKPVSREIAFHSNHLRTGHMTRAHFIHTLHQSHEFKEKTWVPRDFWMVLHRARHVVAAQLPKADRIIDLGGSSEGNPAGAMITYGYPYTFKSLSIVELPREQRHELYTEICGEYDQVIQTPQGPVNYVYTSMSDLSAFDDGTIDLVYAGQSIEHVPVEEAKTVLRQVHRVLKPGGHFCFDTPNRKVTILQFPNYIVDDHKYEYTHQEMTEMLEGHGFAVREAKGMALMQQSVQEGRFIEKEVMGRDRLYDDIENCFLLYYKAQKI